MKTQQKMKKTRKFPWRALLIIGTVMLILLIPNIAFFFILKSLTIGPDFSNLLSIVIGLASVLIGIASVIIPILQIYQEKHSPDAETTSHHLIIYDTVITPITSIQSSEQTIVQQALLPQQNKSDQAYPITSMGEAPLYGILYGRENEIETLKKWIVGEHCQLVAVLGIGGIGKTHLVVHLVEQIKNTFEYVFWQSLLNAPPLENILKNCIQFFSNQQQANISADAYDQINLLITYLNNHRCLLVLDNMESIWRAGEKVGEYRDGYEGYGQFLRRVGESKHQSCLIVTSREKPPEIASPEGKTKPVRSLRIRGLQVEGGEAILKDKGLQGEEYAWKELVERCGGNPLILQLVSQFILEAFGGSTYNFLIKGKITFSNAQDVLQQHFERLTPLEQEILYWLAIEREAVLQATLEENIIPPISTKDLLNALVSLSRRSLIETKAHAYFLQNVIIEYITDRLVEDIIKEIKNEHYLLFDRYALIKAQAKNYVRQSQERLILEPIVISLRNQLLETEGGNETKLVHALTTLRTTSPPITGYAAGNMLNLFIALKCPSHIYDFSDLIIRQAYLQGAKLSKSNFAQTHFIQTTFTDTFGGVLCATFSPDGQLFAVGTANGEVRMWNRNGYTLLRTYHGHTDWVRSIAFSHDSLMLCSGSYDQTIRLWDVNNERCLKIFKEQRCRVYSVAFSPDGDSIASGHEDGQIRLWNIKNGLCFRRLQGHTGRVWSIAFGPDGTKLVSGSEDNTIRLWKTNSEQCLNILKGHTDIVYSVAFSPDNQILASGSEDNTIRLWDITGEKCLNTLRGHKDLIYSVAFSPDSQILASGSKDHTTRLWDIQSGKSSAILQGHTNWVYSVAFSPDGMEIGTGSEDQTVQIYNKNTGQCVNLLQGHCIYVYSVAFSPNSNLLVSGDKQGVRLWNPKNKQCLKLLSGHMNSVRTIAFSPDGKQIASGSEDQHILLWETETGQYTHRLQGHSKWVTTVIFSPDGKLLASGSNDQTIRLWEVSSGTCISILEGHEDWIRSVIFSPDGKILISGSEDQTIRFWDVESGICLKILHGNSGRVCSMACSPDGQIVASGHEDATVNLWNTSDGSCYRILQGHSERVCSVAFSPDGRTLASGGEDQTVRLWKTDTGECITTLRGHSSWIYSVAFNPTGKWLASGSGDETIKIWNVQTRKFSRTLKAERPYEAMNITGVKGLLPAQLATLKMLGAIENKI